MWLFIAQLSKEAAPKPTLPSPTPTPISTAVKVPSTPVLNYVTLGSFSWEQDTDKVKVMCLLYWFFLE
jgi:calcyclin binding protein